MGLINGRELSLWQKVVYITKAVVQASREDYVIPLCYYANFIVRMTNIMYTTFLTLWTSSFIGTAAVPT